MKALTARQSDLDQLSHHLATMASMIEPPPARTADVWADEKRVLPPGSPEPGPWRTSRVPYTRAICEAAADARYSTVVIVTGAQQAKTETLMNIVAHRLDDGPYVPILWVGPTQKNVQSMSGDRWNKLLQSVPTLWDRLEKGHRNKTTEKFIAGVRFGFGWAGSATELASHPAGLVVLDERDRMDSDIGSEGDPVELARARISNYADGRIVIASTPTLDGASPIMTLFDEGTRQIFCWPCPHCGEQFRPRLSLLKWPDGADPGVALREAFMVCPGCGGEIRDHHRNDMMAAHVFLPHAIDEDRGDYHLIDQLPDQPTASFMISGLVSPWRTFGDSASKLVAAYRSGDEFRIQAVVNTIAGEPYKVTGSRPEWDQVHRRRLPYGRLTVPHGVQLITAGVDVQKRGLYYTIRGWGYNLESWKLDHGYIAGDTEFDNPWIMLGNILQKQIGDRAIHRMFIDSGYRPGDQHRRPENVIYSFCRRFGDRAFPTKGHDAQDRPIKSNLLDIDFQGAVLKGGIRLFHLNSDFFKSWIHARVGWPVGEPGGWHLNQETDEDYCRQIIAEEVVTKPSGRRVWIKKSRQNHYLDCEALAVAAAYSLHAEALPPMDAPAPEPKANPGTSQGPGGYIQRPEGSWFNR